MKHLTLFETAAAYNAATLDLPNVSLVEETMNVSYKPYVPETKVVCKYNVTSTSEPTALTFEYESNRNIFKSIEIDGVMQDNLVTEYKFDTTGVHTVKYELADGNTILGNHVPIFNNGNLIECVIPDNVTSISNAAFYGCSGLTSVIIGNGVTSIMGGIFTGCSSLTTLIIGNGSIDGGAFSGLSSLTSVTIGSGVTSIGYGAFSNCTSLTSITVDNNTTYDSRNNCNAIIETTTNTLIQGCKNTIIPGNVTSIGSYAFQGCTSLTSIDIPNSVTSLSESAFSNCTGLTSVTIGNHVTSIGNSAFINCSSLTNMVIPDNVTSIGNWTFQSCTNLTSVTIGSGVTSIGQQAFNKCSGLTSIVSNAITAPTIIADNAFKDIKTGGTLTVPVGSTGYDTWMGTGDYYLGKYNWTKIEQ